MAEFSLRDVVQLAGLSRNIVMRLTKEGIVAPTRTAAREYRFSFQDLIVLRAARGLYASNIPPRRIAASLRRLRTMLPAAIPMCGLRISAVGSDVVVQESRNAWHADTGQLLLDFDASPAGAAPALLERALPQRPDAVQCFERACALEDSAPVEACEQYRHALDSDPGYLNAYLNLGCLLHSLKKLEEAEQVYRSGLSACDEKAALWYNLAVLEEDCGRIPEALESYRTSVAQDPDFADAHFNLARLYAAMGKSQDALRAYNDYRRLQRGA